MLPSPVELELCEVPLPLSTLSPLSTSVSEAPRIDSPLEASIFMQFMELLAERSQGKVRRSQLLARTKTVDREIMRGSLAGLGPGSLGHFGHETSKLRFKRVWS